MQPDVVYKVEEVICDFVTEIVCETSNKTKAKEACKKIHGDYNVTIFIDGKFYDAFEDMTEEEFEQF